jgi:hypothetical protein
MEGEPVGEDAETVADVNKSNLETYAEGECPTSIYQQQGHRLRLGKSHLQGEGGKTARCHKAENSPSGWGKCPHEETLHCLAHPGPPPHLPNSLSPSSSGHPGHLAVVAAVHDGVGEVRPVEVGALRKHLRACEGGGCAAEERMTGWLEIRVGAP